jgi:hypothetical protein
MNTTKDKKDNVADLQYCTVSFEPQLQNLISTLWTDIAHPIIIFFVQIISANKI